MGKIIIKNEAGTRQYELEYNRSAIVRMEKQGFKIEDINEKPLFTITLLMRGAFYMHNPSLSDEEIDAICDELDVGGEEFIKALVENYSSALMSLSGQSNDTKNFKWEKH